MEEDPLEQAQEQAKIEAIQEIIFLRLIPHLMETGEARVKSVYLVEREARPYDGLTKIVHDVKNHPQSRKIAFERAHVWGTFDKDQYRQIFDQSVEEAREFLEWVMAFLREGEFEQQEQLCELVLEYAEKNEVEGLKACPSFRGMEANAFLVMERFIREEMQHYSSYLRTILRSFMAKDKAGGRKVIWEWGERARDEIEGDSPESWFYDFLLRVFYLFQYSEDYEALNIPFLVKGMPVGESGGFAINCLMEWVRINNSLYEVLGEIRTQIKYQMDQDPSRRHIQGLIEGGKMVAQVFPQAILENAGIKLETGFDFAQKKEPDLKEIAQENPQLEWLSRQMIQAANEIEGTIDRLRDIFPDLETGSSFEEAFAKVTQISEDLRACYEPPSTPEKLLEVIDQILDPEVGTFFQCLVLAKSYREMEETDLAPLKERVQEILKESRVPSISSSDLELIFQPPDRVPEGQEGIYFPIGGSRYLDQELNCQKEDSEVLRTKPIDMYTYILWLENQGQSADLVLCAQMQQTNYLLDYPHLLEDQNAEASSRDLAAQGEVVEARFYAEIARVMGLSNLNIKRYESLGAGPSFEAQKEKCRRLRNHPLFERAFSKLAIQRRTEEPKNDEDLAQLELLRAYAEEEVAWILSRNGTKISHPNEAKIGYDPLALVLQNMDVATQQNGIVEALITVNENQKEQLEGKLKKAQKVLPVLRKKEAQEEDPQKKIGKQKAIQGKEEAITRIERTIAMKEETIKALQGRRSQQMDWVQMLEEESGTLVVGELLRVVLAQLEIKLKEQIQRNTTPESYQREYAIRMNRFLFGEKGKNNEAFSFDKYGVGKVKFEVLWNYYCPDSASAASFGSQEGREGLVAPTEPYRTYYMRVDDQKCLLQSNQIPAIPEKNLYRGVFLSLQVEQQKQFFRHSIRPLLRQFVAYLPTAPETYLSRVGRTAQEILMEIRHLKSIMDGVELVRKYIIEPTYIDHEKIEKVKKTRIEKQRAQSSGGGLLVDALRGPMFRSQK